MTKIKEGLNKKHKCMDCGKILKHAKDKKGKDIPYVYHCKCFPDNINLCIG